jgi:N-glycosylase/DNA lyase
LDKLKNVSVEDLSVIKCGFRAKYIKDAVDKILNGDVNIEALSSMDTASARCELLKIKGIGTKVADCILLFGAGKLDAFPIDVWIGRAIEVFYKHKNFSPNIFGQYAGIAQQYLFYYARENKIKI